MFRQCFRCPGGCPFCELTKCPEILPVCKIMGSSKRKSSFRIDDILHQQRETNHHNSSALSSPSRSSAESLSPATNQAKMSKNLQNSNNCEMQQRDSRNGTPESPVQKVATPSVPGHSGGGSDNTLRSPQPLYPPFMDMQKQSPNFYLPLPIGMSPQFSPAAAYLEHYANTLHKGMHSEIVVVEMGISI